MTTEQMNDIETQIPQVVGAAGKVAIREVHHVVDDDEGKREHTEEVVAYVGDHDTAQQHVDGLNAHEGKTYESEYRGELGEVTDRTSYKVGPVDEDAVNRQRY